MKFKDSYTENSYFIKKMKEAVLLKEQELKYPNKENDINEDIENLKKELSSYIIKITPTDYKVYKNNIICYFSINIKSIELRFSYSLSEDGCLIYFPKTVDSIPLYNEIIRLMDDVKKYYMIWKKNWVDKYNSQSIGGE